MKTQVTTVYLSDSERDAMGKALGHFNFKEGAEYGPAIRQARRALETSCEPLADLMAKVHNASTPPGPVVIRNLPFDPSIQRGLLDPEDADSGKSSSISEGILLGLAGQLGEPYGIVQEGQGLVNNLSPSKASVDNLTGLGSRRALGMHIENAAARLLPGDRAPDGLILTGVSPEPGEGPATFVADGRLALNLVGPEVEAVLRDSQRFEVQFPNRWGEGEDVRQRSPIVTGPARAPSFVAALYGDLTRALDDEAEQALKAFEEALQAVALDVVIEPGVCVVIDNHHVFHGRAGFKARFDENGLPYRWLQRVFWTSSLRRFGDWQRVNERLMVPKR
ncbi:MAG: TauD/TfdA family dioxygenase [Gammaproteobacteria bacterium]